MPDDHLKQFKHLRLSAKPEEISYTKRGGGGFLKFDRDRKTHAALLKSEVGRVERKFESIAKERKDGGLSAAFGLILNVESEPGFPLAFTKLETDLAGGDNVVLLNIRHEGQAEEVITKAAIFVPYGKLSTLANKIEAYGNPEKDNRDDEGNVTGPRNGPLLANIASIAVAAFDALWTDPDPLPASDETVWFELWIRRDGQDWEAQLRSEGKRLQLDLPEPGPGQTLVLPEHIIIVASATRNQLESSLDLLNALSEIRKARPCSVGLTDLSGFEQEEWIDEALERIEWPEDDAPAVCIIDSGVNRGHSLIEPLLSVRDTETVFGDGDASDDSKHGTPMAGLAAYGDLRDLMLSTETWRQLHRLESVKLIRTSTPHKPKNYGAVTIQAVSLPEIKAAQRSRVFCMAVTAPGPNTEGNPSAWSSAIDMIASGTDDESSEPRVIILSAGNVWNHLDDYEYPAHNLASPIEDPAQAWNAVTVGAVTGRVTIEEDDDEAQRSRAIAPQNGLSPFSRTSHDWRPDWPLGPDIVMEGGNIGQAEDGSFPHFDSLQPLSTATDFRIRPLTRFNATSAATALVSRVGARLIQRYPDYCPETIRGLLVHGGRWPQELLDRENLDPHEARRTEQVEALIRSYGYGVVDEDRVLNSLSNQATVVAENEIQPYRGEWNDAKLNECHLYALPWPKEILRDHPDQAATLRVTLSYFIQPNPGSRTWEKSQKYHYASSLLRFRPIHKDQPLDDFRARLDAEDRGSDETFTDPGWAVGGTRRGKCGSLVQDVWKGTTAELAEMGHIGIYPAKGWWAYRKFREGHELHGIHLSPVKYSLIISLETEADLPIYNEVAAAITTIETSASVDITT